MRFLVMKRALPYTPAIATAAIMPRFFEWIALEQSRMPVSIFEFHLKIHPASEMPACANTLLLRTCSPWGERNDTGIKQLYCCGE